MPMQRLLAGVVVAAVLALQGADSISASGSANCNSYSQELQRKLDGVCVCRVGSCADLFVPPRTIPALSYSTYTTSHTGSRWAPAMGSLSLAQEPSDVRADLVADLDITTGYQAILGFGASFTDAAGINFDKLKPGVQKLLIASYFDASGLQYSLGRIPIASTDFSTEIYSYNDVPDDFAMDHFSLDREPKSKRKLIQSALNAAQQLQLFASAWAPPVWLTREGTTVGCHIQGEPGGKHWRAWALYISKFITSYNQLNITLFAVTTQNEPELNLPVFCKPDWQSLQFTSKNERDWIKLDLGPILRRNNPEVKILSMDDQKSGILEWEDTLMDQEAAEYVMGTAFHWYTTADFLISSGDFDKLAKKHDLHPDKILLASEACEGYMPNYFGTGSGVHLGDSCRSWQRAENIARDIIGDLQNWVVGWTDWNLILDMKGGPNWANNFVDAPIIVSDSGDELFKQPMYFIIGHFSKFIAPKSIRIGMTVIRKPGGLQAVAFHDATAQKIVIVVQNLHSMLPWKNRARTYDFRLGKYSIRGSIQSRAVQTIVIPDYATMVMEQSS